MRDLIAANAALTLRLAEAEAELTPWRDAAAAQVPAEAVPEPSSSPTRGFCLGTLAEHLFIGAALLFVSRMLMADLPSPPHVVERLLPLLIAIPFGLHFEWKGRPHLKGQIFGAIVFGCLGIVVITGTALLSSMSVAVASPRDLVQAGLALGLGHFAGSMTGRWWQSHLDRKSRLKALPGSGATSLMTLLRNPERLKAEVEAYRTLIEAGAPVAAAATAVWASFGH